MYILPTFSGERIRSSSDFFHPFKSGSLSISASQYTFSREKRTHKFLGLISTALDVCLLGLQPDVGFIDVAHSSHISVYLARQYNFVIVVRV